MAHPLVWPGKYFFYPISNTSSVSLTRDLAPEEHANILLLGCGDPTNVLYTIFSEPQSMGRSLDLTCCDMDPAVLARNVLLFTMVVDKHPYSTTIWNIFFHIYLDEHSYSVLIEQCRKLIELSGSLQRWNASLYGPFLKMCTDYTLTELRRHWQLYVDMQNLSGARMKTIQDAFSQQSKALSQKDATISTSARSAGPLFLSATQISADHFRKYWATGTTFSDPKQVTAATTLNPTFVYSLAGEGCSVHYGTDPLIPFHSAALFGNAKGSVSVTDLVKAAKKEFSDWCSAFLNFITPTVTNCLIVRFFLGEATAVCRALYALATTGTLNLGLPVAQWKTQLIQLSRDEYVSATRAPATFNVVDTSNLDDHIGLLNVLISAVPLLSRSSRSSVLYTESLLFHGEDATKEFTERLYADITAVGLLLGLSPVDYLLGFTTRSNTHELMMYMATKKRSTQWHQVTTWKSPASGDSVAVRIGGESEAPVFDPCQLGTFLYDMYHQLFEQEDAMHFWRLNKGNIMKAIAHSNIIHYTRESFVLFLKLVRERLCIPQERWLEVMDRFFDLEDADQSLPMDSVNYQDLCAQLHRHSVYTVPAYDQRPPKIGRFLEWDIVPPLVRIILTVPRQKLAVLKESADQVGTPLLHCDVRGNWSQNTFASVHVAFGSVIPMGTKSNPRVIFKEDPEGWNGTSSLVASFTMPTRLLTDIEPQEALNVCFSVRSTPGTVLLTSKLGLKLSLFEANLLDDSAVYTLPEQPLPSKAPRVSSPTSSPETYGHYAQIGRSGPAMVDLDEQCELVVSFTCRVSVEDEDVKRLFGSGSMPHIAQVSPCVMRITMGSRLQDVTYPFPVIGSQNRLRLARKSLYIEVIAPISGPFKPDGIKLNLFPVTGSDKALNPWSIHRLNLSRLPVLDIQARKVKEWLNAHVGSMMSSRERSLRKKHQTDTLMFVKDTLHSIFVRSSGVQGGSPRRLFSLRDNASNNCDTIFFINDLKFDLQAHTIVCDGYVLPLTHALMPTISSAFGTLVHKGDMVDVSVFEGEMQAWKKLLPAFVERCRSSWTHGANCEYVAQKRIPLSEEMEEDPLCSCGRGKDVEGMSKVALWSKLAPYVTRVALSPLFAVTYLETVGRDPALHKCYVCRGKGKPKLRTCAVCKKVRYCSEACQKKDWKVHKAKCKPQ
ncbi:hypothetical protein EW146_g1126 [Bondarzewia mesenterica]|uniref:MYND-type domain-containing protein n=1 Tax=Bondarzewia mesenterica TaxID=1095465 RepID=A0A4V3XG58_9AGAM|nr:hypothetical protein EW146_g1126 [Bondarzewia mesenterica]